MTHLQNCRSCSSTDIVTDVSQGDVICRNCGIVLEDRIIDESPEWNNYANDDGNSRQKSRVGDVANAHEGASRLDTIIGHHAQGTKASSAISKANTLANRVCGENDVVMVNHLKRIRVFAERLNLSRSIIDGASHTTSLLMQSGVRMRNRDALAAAMIYIACRQDGLPRTLKEISLSTGVDKKQLGKYFIKISNALQLEMDSHSTVNEYVSRFCSMLGLPMTTHKMATDLAIKANQLSLDSGRAPATVAGGIVYISAAVTESRKSVKDIAQIGSLCEASVKKYCRELNENRVKLFEGIKL